MSGCKNSKDDGRGRGWMDGGRVGWRRERWSDGGARALGYYPASIYSSQGWLDA